MHTPYQLSFHAQLHPAQITASRQQVSKHHDLLLFCTSLVLLGFHTLQSYMAAYLKGSPAGALRFPLQAPRRADAEER